MRYRNAVYVACATLALFVEAIPQGSASTVIATKTASTASIATAAAGAGASGSASAGTGQAGSGSNNAAAVAAAVESGVADASAASGISSGTGSNANVAAAGASGSAGTGSSAGSGTGSAGSVVGAGTAAGAGTGAGAGTAADMGAGAGAGASSGFGDATDMVGSGSPPADMPNMGKWGGQGDWKQWWQSRGGMGNPHQPRGWNEWFAGPGDQQAGQQQGQGKSTHQLARRSPKWAGSGGQDYTGQNKDVGGKPGMTYGGSQPRARDIVASGPSWSDVLSEHLDAQNVQKRGMSMGGGQPQGGSRGSREGRPPQKRWDASTERQMSSGPGWWQHT